MVKIPSNNVMVLEDVLQLNCFNHGKRGESSRVIS